MTFTTPVPLEDALRILREKKLVPTALGSDGLRELAAEVKAAALFSARMTQLRPLQVLAAVLAEMIQGQANVADAKLVLTEVYRALGYDPEQGGFPQDPPGTIPPALRGTLRDLSSERRMELTITTNYRMVTNAAFVKRTTENEQRRYQFPCFELVRIAPRTTPRGFVRRNGQLDIKPGDDWESRWVAAGGELYEKNTRMIALKGAAVWAALGAGEGGYTDTLGNPFPPFAFGSGMGLREVSRGEALTIGVIAPEDQAAAMPSTLRASLKAQAKQIPKDILDAFDDLEDDGEWLRLAKARQLKAEAARKLRNRVTWLGDMLWNARVKNPSDTVRKGWATRRRQREQIRLGDEALRAAIQGQKDVERAMSIPGLGFIDFLWGARGAKRKNEQGATHWEGWGTHHVDSKRGQLAIKMLPRVLVKGRIGKHEEANKRYVRYAGWTAIVKKRQPGRWSVTTLIDDNIRPKRGTKNARLPLRSTGPTTQMRTGLEFPGSTHACQLFAETGAGAAKASSIQQLRTRCKHLAGLLSAAP